MARHIGRAAAAVALLGGARALRYHSNQHHGAGSMVPASPPPPLLTRRLRGGAEFLSSASLLAHNPEMAKTLVSSKLVSKTRMYGFVVLALGLVLSTLGFMLFFNRTLIGTGNLLTIGGVVLIVGHQRAYAFLAQRERARGSGIFLFGVFLVLRGSARLGVLVELFGILNLFGNFIPSLFSLVKSIPVVGPALTPVLESEAATRAVDFISKYSAPSKTTEDEDPMPPPPMPSPDVAQYASSSAFSSMWGMFSSSSERSQILLSAGEGSKAAPKTAPPPPPPPQPSFATLDKDGDGHISPQEWAAYYQQPPPLRDPLQAAGQRSTWGDEPEMPPPADEEGAPPPYTD